MSLLPRSLGAQSPLALAFGRDAQAVYDRLESIAPMRQFFTDFFETNPLARFDVEEQCAAGDRGVVRWRYNWGAGHVRGVDIIRLRDGKIAETLAYVKG